MRLGNFPKADCGRFWILAFTHVDQPKSTEKLNKAILLNLNCSMTGLKGTSWDGRKKNLSFCYLYASVRERSQNIHK